MKPWAVLLAIRPTTSSWPAGGPRTASAEVRWCSSTPGPKSSSGWWPREPSHPRSAGPHHGTHQRASRHQLTSQTHRAMAGAVDLRTLVNSPGTLTCRVPSSGTTCGICFKRDDGGRCQQTSNALWSLLRTGRARTPNRPRPRPRPVRNSSGSQTPQRALLVLNALAEQPGARFTDRKFLHCCRSLCKLWREVTCRLSECKPFSAKNAIEHPARPIAKTLGRQHITSQGLEADSRVVPAS